jgi:hypothetical protein
MKPQEPFENNAMAEGQGKLEKIDGVIAQILSHWYERVKAHYVTDEDSEALGVEPEVKIFHEFGNHRIKFSRPHELDVTYGLGVAERDGRLFIVASVNNKSERFDYDGFLERLKTRYWRSRHEKPWLFPQVDHFVYGDLIHFEPRMGRSIALEIRKDKADLVKLFFGLKPQHEELLLKNSDLLSDLIEQYCLNPLKRIYAESYRGH